MRVVETGNGARFSHELLGKARFQRKGWREDLDRHLTLKGMLCGQKYMGHPALAQPFGNSVSRKS